MGTFVRECQVFAGHFLVAQLGTTHREAVNKFVSRLPVPEHPLEILAVDRLLFNVAVQWSHRIHEQHHTRHSIECDCDPNRDLLRCWSARHSSPVSTFADWATTFLDNVERSHPPSPTARVKEMIDRGRDHRLSLKSLAREAGCHPVRLRAIFKHDVGMPIREYQTRRRIMKAAQMLAASDVKVDAIARSAGFPNRKNFYDAFKRKLGTNPSAVRHWSTLDLESSESRLFPGEADSGRL
jgi:AraC-like DNA-binding protein